MNLRALTTALAVLSMQLVHATKNADSTDLQELAAAAAAGDAGAQFQLGRAYFRGEGMPKDEKKAVEWIKKSAEQGNNDAITSMGFFYTRGVEVKKSEAKAVEWFRKGAEKGDPLAQLNLGLMLRQGKTIQLDHKESLKWLDKAAASGDPDAVKTVGQLYFMGDALMMPEQEAAYPFVLEAAEAGDPECQNMMGLICLEGLGQEAKHKDLEKALNWFRLSAEQGNAKGQSNLAHALGVESPVSDKRQEALMWLYMAVDQSEPLADKTLKEIFMSIPPDLAQRARGDIARQLIINAARGAGKNKKAPATPDNQSAAPKTDD